MVRRPLSVTVVACLYIAAGAAGLAYHLRDFAPPQPFRYEMVWASLVRLIAIVCGVYMLRGHNWARWLALAWIAFHVVLSAFLSPLQFVTHSVLCGVFAYILFRPRAREYFASAAGARGTNPRRQA